MRRYRRLLLTVPAVTPRLAYAAAHFWGYYTEAGDYMARVPYRLQVQGRPLPEDWQTDDVLQLTHGLGADSRADANTLYAHPLLYRNDTAPIPAEIRWLKLPCWFHGLDIPQEEFQPQRFPFDVLAAVFYLLTEYETTTHNVRDDHGRYDPRSTGHHQQELWRYPLIPLWLEWFAEHFNLQLTPAPQLNVEWTLDIDETWRYLHKPLGRTLAALFRDIFLRNDADSALLRMDAWLTGEDPYAQFEFLTGMLAPAQLRFFALDADHALDNPYGFDFPAYGQLLRGLAAAGYAIGLHPGYLTATDPERLARQHTRLVQALGAPVTAARQHYLKNRQPDTFRTYLALGILHDYTTASSYAPGFRQGLATAFRWFDVQQNVETPLLRHPSHVMDRTLEKYRVLSPEEALNLTRCLWQTATVGGGTFRLIVHNSTFSRAFEWKGWEAWWQPLLQDTRNQARRSSTFAL